MKRILDLSRVENPVGAKLVFDDQEYRLTEVTYRGEAAPLLSWETKCATCGDVFVVITGRRFNLEQSRRCKTHRRPGVPASVERRPSP